MQTPRKQLTRMIWKFDWSSSVEEFLVWKQLQGVSKYAIIDHKQAWSLFLRRYPDLDVGDVAAVRRAILGFLQNRNAAYYNKILQALRQFFDYLIDECDMKFVNPCKGLKYKPTPRRIVDHDAETIKSFLKVPDKSSFVGYRDYVFMILMIDTGIRPHEAIQLQVADIETKGVWVREAAAKTRQPRFLPASPMVLNGMRRLIQAKAEFARINDYVFVTNAGKPLSVRELRWRFRTHAEKLGINLTPYHLRHFFALNFIRNGGNVYALQKMMGHSRITMTETYVQLAAADIAENHAKASPLSKLLL